MSRERWDRAAIGALVVMQLVNAIGEAIPLPEVLESFEKTELPRFLLPFLVATKLAAALALLLPGRRLLAEWAFAGILIDVLGAGASYVLAGHLDALGLWMVPPALLVWGLAYRAHRRQHGPPPADARSRAGAWADRALAAFVLVAAMGEILRVPAVTTSMQVVQFPEQTLVILSVAKVLAVLALLVPGVPTLRTWARAGLAFNVAGALYSYAAVGVLLLPDVPLLLLLASLLAASTWLATRRPAALAPSASPA